MAARKRKLLVRTAAAAAVVAALGAAFAYGYLCNERKLPGYGLMSRAYSWSRRNAVTRQLFFSARDKVADHDRPPGRWDAVGPPPGDDDLTDAQRRAMAELNAIGYLPGYEPATGTEGVTVHAPAAFDGLNLYTSGDAQQAVLMDMDGAILHTWSSDFRDAFPDHPEPGGQWRSETWTRVHLLAGGDLLAIYERLGMIRLDKDSNLVWANALGFHHDLFVGDDGTIFALSEEVKVLPRIHPYEPVVEDFITVVDAGGAVTRRVSLLEAFERSPYAPMLEAMPPSGDLFHTNTIEVLDGRLADRLPAFAAGNVLVSLREISTIAVVDMEREQVVWALSGQWKAQHHPTVLDTGTILLLDNLGSGGASKVIELDPLTQEIVWAYEGTPANGFFTRLIGANQRLPNGNTLITESTRGRVLEVTPDGRIAWEFLNPARAGDDGELVATLFEMVRIPRESVSPWLEGVQ